MLARVNMLGGSYNVSAVHVSENSYVQRLHETPPLVTAPHGHEQRPINMHYAATLKGGNLRRKTMSFVYYVSVTLQINIRISR